MGVVATQSFKNVISTYLGFGIGAINTLFLYTNFMSDDYYGLVGFMLAAGYVMMPLMAFGVHNTIVKFYSSFKTRLSLNSFLILMLLLPLAVIIPLTIVGVFGYESISRFLSSENSMIKNYLWHTFIVAVTLAYFEVFYAWVKVEMLTVFGNFMKEVFHRIGTTVLLLMLFYKMLDVENFILGLVIVYLLRMLIMMSYAFYVKLPVIVLKKIRNIKAIINYSALMIIAGSVATMLLDIDKVMIGKYIPIENIAYYNVAVFIATVIAVPMRSMHQILLPLSAKYINEKNYKSLHDLYKRSSISLFIVSGFVFLLIIANINEMYKLIPEEYSVGLYVVLLTSFIRLFDALLGSNNAIIFNSDYYKVILFLGVVLLILMVILNVLLIPIFGLNGAAIATFIAVFLYNLLKIGFVYKAFGMLPFSEKTLIVIISVVLFSLGFYFWDFGFHPILNITLKSILITGLFCGFTYKFEFSKDINNAINNLLKKIKI